MLNISPNIYTFIVFIGYILIIVTVGLFSAKFSSRGLSEFFHVGRKMNKFIAVLIPVASGRSSWLLLGLIGMAYMRGFLAFIITIFMTAYIRAQSVEGGKAFSTSFDLSPGLGVIFTASIVLIYTLLGGFMVVSITDVIQGCFMIAALFLLPIVAVIDLGGISNTITTIYKYNAAFFDLFSLSAGAMIGFLGIGFGVLTIILRNQVETLKSNMYELVPVFLISFFLTYQTSRIFYEREKI